MPCMKAISLDQFTTKYTNRRTDWGMGGLLITATGFHRKKLEEIKDSAVTHSLYPFGIP